MGQTQGWDTRFGVPGVTGTGINDVFQVNAVAFDAGGNAYVGGVFSTAGGTRVNGIARWNGTGWESLGGGIDYYNHAFSSNEQITAIAVMGNDVYAGGRFDSIGGIAANNIAKWNTATKRWSTVGGGIPSFSPYAPARVSCMAVSGNTLYVGGYFDSAGTIAVHSIAKWNGSTWDSLGGGLATISYGYAQTGTVSAISVNGTDVYVGGQFGNAGDIEAKNCAKWDGTSWSALGKGLRGGIFGLNVNAVAVMGGEVYYGGVFDSAGTVVNQNMNLAKWKPSTNEWASATANFTGTGMYSTVYALYGNGNDLYVGGSGLKMVTSALSLARYNSAAGVWSAVGGSAPMYNESNSDGQVNALAMNSANTALWVGGKFGYVSGTIASNIAVFADNVWKMVYDPSSNGIAKGHWVNAIAVDKSDQLYVAGNFMHIGNIRANKIACWNGTSWTALGNGSYNGLHSFSTAGSRGINAITAVGTDIYFGGVYDSIGGMRAKGIARWTGTKWDSIPGGFSGTVLAIASLNNDIYVGGTQTSVGALKPRSIVRFNTDSKTWFQLGSGYKNGVGNSGTVNAIAAANGEIYVGGTFDTAGTVASKNIAKYSPSTDTWTSLAFAADGSVSSLRVDGGKIYVIGSFSKINNIPCKSIAILDIQTGTWSAANLFGTLYGTISSVLPKGNDVYFIGNFSNSSNGLTDTRMRVWNSVTNTFRTIGMFTATGSTKMLVSNSAGDIYAGGAFNDVDGISSVGVARYGSAVTSVENEVGKTIPSDLSLSQNYPNPFNPSTTINYQLSHHGRVTLKVYDILGCEVMTLVDGIKEAGHYSVSFSGSKLASGVYFARLQSGGTVRSTRMLLLK